MMMLQLSRCWTSIDFLYPADTKYIPSGVKKTRIVTNAATANDRCRKGRWRLQTTHFFPFQRGHCDARCYFAMTTCWTPNNHSLPASLASPHFRSYRSVSSTYCRTCWEKRKKNTSPELHEGSHVTTFLASHTLVGLYHYQVNIMYWEPKVNILLQHTTEGILFVSAAQKSLSGLWRLLTFLVVTKTAAYLFNVSVIIRTKVSNVKEKTVWEVQGQHVQRTHSVKVTVLE